MPITPLNHLNYFFLYPVGHLGLTAVTFLFNFPFTQVIVDFLPATGVAAGIATGA
jgi:hypothetical protein